MHWMLRVTAAPLVLMAVFVTAGEAQSDAELGGWTALMVTPFGALPTLVTPAMAGFSMVEVPAGNSIEARFGRWSFGDSEEPWNNFGIGGRGEHIGIALGYGKCEGCDDGVIMGGMDYEWVLTEPRSDAPPSLGAFVITLRPAAGLAIATGEGNTSAGSLALDIPVSFPVAVGEASRLAAFIAPGIGYGRFSTTNEDGDDETESGTRPSLAAGIAFAASGAFGFHLGWRKIFIKDGPSVLGVGVSYGG